MARNSLTPTPSPWSVPRKHPRAQLLAQVEAQADGVTALGQTRDISEGGLCVLSPDTFDLNTEVLVRFNLPAAHHIEAKGLVVRALRGLEMGIVFIGLRNDDRQAIAKFAQQALE